MLIFQINGRPTAKLCDFGLSRIEDESASGLTTSTYHGKGTTSYLSPELIENEDPKRDLKSDIWAWACLVLEVGFRRIEWRIRSSYSSRPLRSRRTDVPTQTRSGTTIFRYVSYRATLLRTKLNYHNMKVSVACSRNAGRRILRTDRRFPHAAIVSWATWGRLVRRPFSFSRPRSCIAQQNPHRSTKNEAHHLPRLGIGR